MTTWLIILGVVLAYLAIGVLYARSKAIEVYREKRKSNERVFSMEEYIEYWTVLETRERLLILTACWALEIPVMALKKAFDRTGGLLLGPVTAQRRRATKLAEDAAYWRKVAEEEVDLEKKSMAEELARVLREQAKEAAL